MGKQDNVKVILLSDLWDIFVSRLWIMILAAVLAVGMSVICITMTFVPRYNSVATLYILQQNQAEPDMDYKDFDLALEIVNDCTHLIKSHSVLDSVIKEFGFNMSYRDLYESVRIENPTDTRILEVTVESSSPRKAKHIVDAICTVGTEKITEAMGFEQVYFYEKGILDYNPCNRTSILTYLIIGVIVVAVVYAIFLAKYILDDKIRTDEDIKKYLELSILGDIPNYDNTKKKKYGRKYYCSKYYRNRYYQGSVYGEVAKK